MIADEVKDRYGTDVDMEFLLDFIHRSAKDKRPFLACLSTCLPHFPWELTPDSGERGYRAPHAEHKGDPSIFRHGRVSGQDGGSTHAVAG